MTSPSPLQSSHEAADAQFTDFGEATIVSMHDVVETEYGRLRAGATVMDCPHRSLIQLTGNERLDFLHRLMSQDLAGLAAGAGARSFLLNTKGQVLSDAVVLHDELHTRIDVNRIDAPGLIAELDKMLFGEDVQIADVTDDFHRLSLHGPKVSAHLGDDPAWSALAHRPVELAGAEGHAYRHDQCGVPGLHVWLPAATVEEVWPALTNADRPDRARPLGWLAFNMARIEAGTPLFHVDFGPDSLPGETSIADQAVSRTKGCYRGQEVVATMRDRGHPSKLLVGFQADSDKLPTAGTPVYAEDSAEAKAIGAVTSSTMSPMKGSTPIGIAMVKWGHHEPGTTLYAPAEGGRVAITVHGLAD